LALCVDHGESTYESGEITAKRWIMPENTLFYSKGKGRNIICSDFLITRPSSPFFSLTDKEYAQALKQYLEFNNDIDVSYDISLGMFYFLYF
jgi:hypothetical protein